MKHRNHQQMSERFKRLIAYDPLAGLRNKKRADGGKVTDDSYDPFAAEKFIPQGAADWTKQAAGKDVGVLRGVGQELSKVASIPKRAIEGAQYDLATGDPTQAIAPSMDAAMILAGGAPLTAEKGAAGVFGGRLSKLADHDAIAKAAEMEKAGASSDAIWAETGTARGADRQWRQEIDDSKAVLRMHPSESNYLDDGLHHPELYAAYPHLRDVVVEPLSADAVKSGVRGQYSPSTNTIKLAGNLTPEQARSTLLHEIQHAVQQKEGFARGDNPSSHLPSELAPARAHFEEVRSNTQNEIMKALNTSETGVEYMKDLIRREEYGPKAAQHEISEPFMKVFGSILEKNPELKEKLSNIVHSEKLLDAADRAAHKKYSHAMGEVEARNVQTRLDANLSDIEPRMSEDTPRFLQRNRADGGRVKKRFADFRRSENVEDRRQEKGPIPYNPPSASGWVAEQMAATSDDNPLSKALGVQDIYAKRAEGGIVRDGKGRFASGGSVDGRPHMADGGIPSFDQTQPVNAGPPPFEATQPVEPDIGKIRSLWQGAKAGATFNFNDELSGVSAAAPQVAGHDIPEFVGPVPTKTIAGMGRLAYEHFVPPADASTSGYAAYEKARDEERKAGELAKSQHPYLHMAGEIAGSLPAMAVLPEVGAAARLGQAASKGAQFGAKVLDSAMLGGEYAGLSGVGAGKDIGDRAMQGAEGIVGGIVGGAVAPVVGGIAGAAYDKFGKPIVNAARGAMNPEAEAARRLAISLKADQELIKAGKAEGMSWQEWAAARAAGEPVTLAELGSSHTQALLRSAANTSPEGRAILEKTINERFAGQSERVADEVRGLVAGGANAHKTGDQLVAEYDRARVPAYKQAYREGDKEIVSPTIERLMGSPMFESAMKSAVTSGKDRAITEGYGAFNPGVTVENGMIKFTKTKPNGVPQYPNLQYWDAVKKELDGIATMAKRSGDPRGDVAANMSKTLRAELDQAVPSYGNARGIAAQYFGESNALEAGQKLAGKKVDPKVIKDVMAKMKPDEKDLFREGYASDWAGRVIGNHADSRDITKAMFNSPNERERALAVFGPQGMKTMQTRMTLETIMDGARKAMGNSTTARQLIEAGLAGGALGGYEGYEHGGLWGGLAGTAAGAGQAAFARKQFAQQISAGAGKLIGKVDARTAKLVAELLTSNDPNKLQQGLRMAQKNQKIADGLRSLADRMALAGQNKTVAPYVGSHLGPLQGPVPAGAEDEKNKAKREFH